jgi:hypothetical protein
MIKLAERRPRKRKHRVKNMANEFTKEIEDRAREHAEAIRAVKLETSAVAETGKALNEALKKAQAALDGGDLPAAEQLLQIKSRNAYSAIHQMWEARKKAGAISHQIEELADQLQ